VRYNSNDQPNSSVVVQIMLVQLSNFVEGLMMPLVEHSIAQEQHDKYKDEICGGVYHGVAILVATDRPQRCIILIQTESKHWRYSEVQTHGDNLRHQSKEEETKLSPSVASNVRTMPTVHRIECVNKLRFWRQGKIAFNAI
jgi:hypothetical protein